MADMKRLAYGSVNYGNISVTPTTEGTAQEVITLPVLQFDGSTQILLEFNWLAWGATTGFDCVLVLFDGDTPLGEIWRAQTWVSSGGTSGNNLFRVLTPSSGLHRYNIRGWATSGANFVLAADKAGENASPMFLRAYALAGPGTADGDDVGTRVEVGMFQPSNTTGSRTITLNNEDFGQVDLLLLMTAYQTVPADTDGNGILSVGIGTDRGGTVSQYNASLWDEDNQTTITTAIAGNTSSILKTLNSNTGGVDFEMDLLSLGPAQFEIDVTDTPTTPGIRIYYLALGGTDVTDALVSTFDSAAATGTQDVTVVSGFGLPDLILPMVGHPPGGQAGANIRYQFGAGKNDVDMGVTGYSEDDGTANVEMSSYQSNVFIAVPNNDTAMGQVATLSARGSWPTDGFQINKSVAGIQLAVMAYAALKGVFRSVIGFNTVPTAAPTQTQDLEVGTTPRGGIFFHNVLPTTAGQNNSYADLGAIGMGITDGVRQYWVGMGDDDTSASSIAHRNGSESKTVKMFTPSASGTLTSEASASVVGTALRLTWADTDSVAREYRYVLFGDGPTINLDPGAYTVTGASAGLVVDRALLADPGSYTVNGVAADLVAEGELEIMLDPGVYAVNGVAADLVLTGAFDLDADPGAYAVTGATALLLAERVVLANPGTYTVTGFDTELVVPAQISADPGAYTVTGIAAQLVWSGGATVPGTVVGGDRAGAYASGGDRRADP